MRETRSPRTFWSIEDERNPKQMREVKKARTPRMDHITTKEISALGALSDSKCSIFLSILLCNIFFLFFLDHQINDPKLPFLTHYKGYTAFIILIILLYVVFLSPDYRFILKGIFYI
jgi:hypothetical protein